MAEILKHGALLSAPEATAGLRNRLDWCSDSSVIVDIAGASRTAGQRDSVAAACVVAFYEYKFNEYFGVRITSFDVLFFTTSLTLLEFPQAAALGPPPALSGWPC